VEKDEKIAAKSGMFFVSKKTVINAPRSTTLFTTNSPRKNHVLHALFPKPPLKTPAKTTKPRLAPGSHFF
jgi:hypothetical protein